MIIQSNLKDMCSDSYDSSDNYEKKCLTLKNVTNMKAVKEISINNDIP